MTPEERVSVLLKAPPNGWVAFSEDEERFIAYGASYDEVIANAKEKGESKLALVKVPPNWETMIL